MSDKLKAPVYYKKTGEQIFFDSLAENTFLEDGTTVEDEINKLKNFSSDYKSFTNYLIEGNSELNNNNINSSVENYCLELSNDNIDYSIKLPSKLLAVGDYKDKLFFDNEEGQWIIHHYCREWNSGELEGEWSINSDYDYTSSNLIEFKVSNRRLAVTKNNYSICDIFPSNGKTNSNGEYLKVAYGYFYLRILKNKLSDTTPSALDEYFKNNPFRIITVCEATKLGAKTTEYFIERLDNETNLKLSNVVINTKSDINFTGVSPTLTLLNYGSNKTDKLLYTINRDELIRDVVEKHEKNPNENSAKTSIYGHPWNNKDSIPSQKCTINPWGLVYIQQCKDYNGESTLVVEEIKLMVYRKSTQKWEVTNDGRMTGGAFYDQQFAKPNTIEADITYDENDNAYIKMSKEHANYCFHFWGNSVEIEDVKDILYTAGVLKMRVIGNDNAYTFNVGADCKGKNYALLGEMFQSRFKGLRNFTRTVYGMSTNDIDIVSQIASKEMFDNLSYPKTKNTLFTPSIEDINKLNHNTEIDSRYLLTQQGLKTYQIRDLTKDTVNKFTVSDLMEINPIKKIYFTSTTGSTTEYAVLGEFLDGFVNGKQMSMDITIKKISKYGSFQYCHAFLQIEKSGDNVYMDKNIIEKSDNWSGNFTIKENRYLGFQHKNSDVGMNYVGTVDFNYFNNEFKFNKDLLIPTFNKTKVWKTS